MEHQDPQLQKSIEHFSALQDMQAPGTLLSGVMSRITHLDEYLTAQKSVHELMQALSDSRWEVRAAAIHALGEREETPSLDICMRALRDEHPMVRVAAVRVLRRLEEHISLDLLMQASHDQAGEVREMAALVLAGRRQQAKNSSLHVVHVLGGVQRSIYHFWLVFISQLVLLRGKSLFPALLLFLSYGLTLLIVQSTKNLHEAVVTLGLVTTLATAMGIAFSSTGKTDVDREITISTPTSLASITFSRFLIVIGSNMMLSACASVAIALLYGQGPWNIIQFWLAPLFVTASLTLALVPLLGSWLSFLIMGLLEIVQTVQIEPSGDLHLLAHSYLWQTNPFILVLAFACLLFAFLYIPRQSAYSSDSSV